MFKDVHHHQLTSNERLQAVMKMENLSHKAVTLFLIVLFSACILCIAWSIFLSVSLDISYSPGHTYLNFVIYVNWVLLLLAVTGMLFLVVTFPMRTISHAIKRKISALPEQSLLIMLLVVLLILPSTSVSGVIQLLASVQDMEIIYEVSQGGAWLSLIVQSFLICFSLYFIAALTRTISTKDELSLMNLLQMGSVRKIPHDVSAALLSPESLLENQRDRGPSVVFRKNSCTYFVKAIREGFWRVNKASTGTIIMILFYLAYTLFIAAYFNFLPSVVPFVGVISVLKVCSLYPPVIGETMPGMINCTYNGHPYAFCPSGSIPFWRAICIGGQFIIETIIVLQLRAVTRNARYELSKLPYAKYRAKHLTFRFFIWGKHVTTFSVLACAVINTAVPSSYFWIYSKRGSLDTSCLTVPCVCDGVSTDPLVLSGITTIGHGFPIIYLNLMGWICGLALAFLPPNSKGVIGWCWGSTNAYSTNDANTDMYFITEVSWIRFNLECLLQHL